MARTVLHSVDEAAQGSTPNEGPPVATEPALRLHKPRAARKSPLTAADLADRGCTPEEFAKVYRLGPDRVRAWIRSGALGAINVAKSRSGRPRFIILPRHVEAFEKAREVGPPAKSPPRRRRSPGTIDFYPEPGCDRSGTVLRKAA